VKPETTNPLAGLCLVGTDTGVGKTFLTARIARQLLDEGVSVGIYKPACSGCLDPTSPNPVWEDVELLSEALGHHFPRERICPQAFLEPLAPPVAARLENRAVDPGLLLEGVTWWRSRVELLLIEGAGGLLSPLTDDWTICDLIERWNLPLLIVGHLGLGTINHTLLTVEAALRRGLSVSGILLNETVPNGAGLSGPSNPEEIAKRSPVPILAVIPYQESPGLRPLPETSTMNWRAIARTVHEIPGT
jgi:dethiobiotin synthetase